MVLVRKLRRVLIRFGKRTVFVLSLTIQMRTHRKLGFCLLFGAFLVILPTAHASADSGRYFVKSTKGFWKNAFGVRHSFDDGFSADLSDFQIRLAKMLGVAIEPITVLQILPDDPIASSAPNVDPSSTPESTTTPVITKIPPVRSIKGKGGAIR